MYLMFMFAIKVGSAFIDFFDISGGPCSWMGAPPAGAVQCPDWLGAVLADGIGAGLQTVATFIPVVGCLFSSSRCWSSGYLARAAFVVDALMRRLGLPGKAFVPMLMGFGCTVPAVMATRTLGSERERLMTSAMAPSCRAVPVCRFTPCSRWPSSPSRGRTWCSVSICSASWWRVLTGLFLRSTLLPGKSDAMVMEMPDYRRPVRWTWASAPGRSSRLHLRRRQRP